MMFRKGDRVRFKSHVTNDMMLDVGISELVSDLGIGKASNIIVSVKTGKIDHFVVRFETHLGTLAYCINPDWIERVPRDGHHLTKIFK